SPEFRVARSAPRVRTTPPGDPSRRALRPRDARRARDAVPADARAAFQPGFHARAPLLRPPPARPPAFRSTTPPAPEPGTGRSWLAPAPPGCRQRLLILVETHRTRRLDESVARRIERVRLVDEIGSELACRDAPDRVAPTATEARRAAMR